MRSVNEAVISIESASMLCQGITCYRPFDMGLTAAEGQKL